MINAPTARVLTWNLERKRPDTPRGAEAIEVLFDQAPDVMVLTEARTSFPARSGHALWSEPPRGSGFAEDERKVLIWSREPWRDVDRIGVDGVDQTRFISATTDTPIGPLRIIGVCIPWHMAEVTHQIDVKRKPWEQHIRYLEVLSELVAAIDTPTVIAGDFNQHVPRIKYGNHAAAAAMAVAFSTLDVVTRGQIEGCTRPGIDHVAVSRDLTPARVWGWPNKIEERRLSDHEGAGVDLTVSRSRVVDGSGRSA